MKTLILLLCTMLSATAFGQDPEIYVSDAGHFEQPPWQILKFDDDGTNPGVAITQNLGWPQDILFLEQAGTVLVSNLTTNRINRYNATTGAFISVFADGISGPTRMKIGPDGLLYVLQWGGNGRVLRYQLNGSYVGEFTTVGVPQAIGLDWDSQGNLYVSSYTGAYVRRFAPNGSDMGLFISTDLMGPTNIWFRSNGELLVLDYDGDSAKHFSSNGSYLGIFIGGLSSPEGIAQLPNGNLLIGDGGTSSVKLYTAAGAYIKDIVPSGTLGLVRPNAVVVRHGPGGAVFAINQGLSDAWYDPVTTGQGFLVTVFTDRNEVFLAWFTYDTERPPEDVTAILGDPGHRWLTAQGSYLGRVANLTVYQTVGGVFDAANPKPKATSIGTMTLEFNACNSATATYDIPSLGLSGEIPLQRIVTDGVALCEALSGP